MATPSPAGPPAAPPALPIRRHRRPVLRRPALRHPVLRRACLTSLGFLAVVVGPGPAHGQDPVAAPQDVADPCADALSTDPAWAWVGSISGRPARELTRRSLEGVGESTLSRAVQQLRRAMAAPPVCPADAVALAALATALQDRIALREAREALQDRIEVAPDDGVAHLWLARAAAAAGSPDALGAAQAAIAAGADRAGAALAAARAAFDQGMDEVATAAYFPGLQAAVDADALAGYVGDLGPTIRMEEGDAFRDLDAEGQARWLARFWIDRAGESGVTPQERLSEHYRRVRRAYASYCGACVPGPVTSPVIPYGRVGLGLDERGLVYLLQGEPDVVVETQGNALPPNASWAWRRAGGELAVHFAVIDPGTGWQIMEDPLAIVNPARDPLALDEEMPDRPGVRSCVVDGCEGRYVADFYRYLVDRGAISPRFQTLANQYRSRPADWGENAVSGFIVGGPLSGQPSFRFEAVEELAEIRARDVFVPGRWALGETALRAVSFRDAEGGVSSWLAVGGIWPDSAPAPGRVDATLREPEGDAAGPVLRSSARADLSATGRWVVPVAPEARGDRAVAMVFREGDEPTAPILGSASGVVAIDVPRGDRLDLSGLVAWAGDEGSGDVDRAGALGRLAARPVLAADGAASLYFEIYGLPADQVYETRIRIERAEGDGVFRRLMNLFGGEDPSELRFRGETTRPDAVRAQSLSLTLPDLDPGRYRLEVEVRHRLVQVARTLEFEVPGEE